MPMLKKMLCNGIGTSKFSSRYSWKEIQSVGVASTGSCHVGAQVQAEGSLGDNQVLKNDNIDQVSSGKRLTKLAMCSTK